MFKTPFLFEGRIRRTEYIMSFFVSVCLMVIVQVIAATSRDSEIIYIVFIPIYWFLWAQGAKRSHDIGNSGWWQIIPFYALWLFFVKGEICTNKYGKDPKGFGDINEISQIGGNFKTEGDSNINFTDSNFSERRSIKASDGSFELFVLIALPSVELIYIIYVCTKY